MNEFDEKEVIRKDQRWDNLNNLYKEISYIDYDKNTYKESSQVIKDTLNTILAKSDDISFNEKIEDHITLIDMDRTISPATDNIEILKSKYASVI